IRDRNVTGVQTCALPISIMNVLLPAFIKEKFPHRVGRMTSVYSTSMNIFAATAAGLSVPLANGIGLGWELALLSWALITIVGIIDRKSTRLNSSHVSNSY